MKQFIIKYQKKLIAAAALLIAAGTLTGVLLHRQAVRRQEEARAETERLLWEQHQQQLAAQRDALAARLQGTWTQTVPEDRNSLLELSVTDGTIVYGFRNVRFPEYNQTFYTYTWSVFDGTSIAIRFPEGGEDLHEIVFTPAEGDSPEKVTFSPAFTAVPLCTSTLSQWAYRVV